MSDRLLLLATELVDRLDQAKTATARDHLLCLAISALELYDLQPRSEPRLHAAALLRQADLLLRYANQPERCDAVISRILVLCGSRADLSRARSRAILMRCMMLQAIGQTKTAVQLAKDSLTIDAELRPSFLLLQHSLEPTITSARALRSVDDKLGRLLEVAVHVQQGRSLPADLPAPSELKDIVDHLHLTYSLMSHLFAGETATAAKELAVLQSALDGGAALDVSYTVAGVARLQWLDREAFVALVLLLSGAVSLGDVSSRRGHRMLEAGLQQLATSQSSPSGTAVRLRYELQLLQVASFILHSQVAEAASALSAMQRTYGEAPQLALLRAAIAQSCGDVSTARELYASLADDPELGLLAQLSTAAILRHTDSRDASNDLLRSIERDCMEDALLCTTHLLLQGLDAHNAPTLTKRLLNDVVQRSVVHCNAQFRKIAFGVLACRAVGDSAEGRFGYAAVCYKLAHPSDLGDRWHGLAARRIAASHALAGAEEKAQRYQTAADADDAAFSATQQAFRARHGVRQEAADTAEGIRQQA